MTEAQRRAAKLRHQREAEVCCPVCDGKGWIVSRTVRARAKKAGNASYLKSLEPGQLSMSERGRRRERLAAAFGDRGSPYPSGVATRRWASTELHRMHMFEQRRSPFLPWHILAPSPPQDVTPDQVRQYIASRPETTTVELSSVFCRGARAATPRPGGGWTKN